MSPTTSKALRLIRPLLATARAILSGHWRTLALLFGAVLLPLYAFAELAEDVWTEHGVAWDRPILEAIHLHASPARDAAMIFISRIGFQWGTVPLTLLIGVVLFLSRRLRQALFFSLATGGSAGLNQVVKLLVHRTRPALWPSPAPETTFSFPSGHAMGSMALAAAISALAWNTRARWVALGAGAAYVVSIAFSRLYLGVHYPSDVLAAWAAALAWVVGTGIVMFGRASRARETAAVAQPTKATGVDSP